MSDVIAIVGAGLAGSEAAWQAAQRGGKVVLYEMRPTKMTAAHKTDLCAELVCSNSLKSNDLATAHGMLKEELRRLGSLVMQAADATAVPAGQALAVDRDLFAAHVTEAIDNHPAIELRREEITQIPNRGPAIIASGPLTSQPLARALFRITGSEYMFFYDAISPIVDADSIDRDKVFIASRYDKGDAAYINCPMTREEYEAFYEELINAEMTMHADYDPKELFEGCLPIEIIAGRGKQTMAHGPMKPVGLEDPHTGQMPYAVVQLRPENQELTMYNLVGFQTSLTWSEQKRVFRMIPGLERAEFLRYGAVHRNTYVNAPTLLRPTNQLRSRDDLFLAGQITGVEGYVESIASGWLAGVNAVRLLQGAELLTFPRETMLGALTHYITTADASDFQPMNANFGLLPPLETEGKKIPKKERKALYSERGLETLATFIADNDIAPVAGYASSPA